MEGFPRGDDADVRWQADARGTATAMVVPACFMVAAWTYAVCVNFVPAYRDPADKIGAATIGLEKTAEITRQAEVEGELEKKVEVHREVA